MKFLSLKQLGQQIKTTIFRFPLAILSAVIGTTIALVWIHTEMDDPLFIDNLLMTTVLGFPLLLSIKLFLERQNWNKTYDAILQIAGVLFLIVYYFLLPENLQDAHGLTFIRFILFGIGFLLSVTFAPFINKDEINGFWQYNKTLFIRFFFTGVYTGTLYAGLAIALLAIDQLLGIDVDEKLYFEMWVFIVGIIATYFFLSGVPQKIKTLQKATDYPKGIKMFTQYILVPLVIIYSIILYAYSAKIIITDNWPKGMVTFLILFFAFVGILASVLLYPIKQKKEYVWIKWLSKIFYIILIPLTGVLFWAIWIRVSEYGLTENRYFVILWGFWLIGMAIYFTVSKKQNIKIITLSLFFIILLSSFGPWGALAVSESNQVNRLEKVLISNNILVDGKIKKSEQKVSPEDINKISGVLDYLDDIHGLTSIQPWFDEDLESLKNENKRVKMPLSGCYRRSCFAMDLMGLDYRNRWDRREENSNRQYFSFRSQDEEVSNIQGYDYLLNFSLNSDSSQEFILDKDKYFFDLNEKTSILTLKKDDQNLIDIDMKLLVENLSKTSSQDLSYNIPKENMIVKQADQGIKIKVQFKNIDMQKKDDDIEINHLTGYILVGRL